MLAHRQPMISSVRRDAWLEVDLNAIERNIAVIRSWLSPQTRLMGVVKSDAYGHGASGVAELLEASGTDCLGVASVDEGCQLRQSGIRQPILLLSPCPSWAIPAALEANLELTVTAQLQLKDISDAASRIKRPAAIQLKIDSGMHRLGINPQKLPDIMDGLNSLPFLKLAGIFTHFAQADQREFTMHQTRVFQEAVSKQTAKLKSANAILHLASGEAARHFPETHFDMVRVGLYLYGLEAKKISDQVYPALSVRGRINHIQEINESESVGYNLTWTASRKTKIASVPIGYADGVDRGLSNRICGLLMGKEVKQIGLISMDQMLFDISELPDAEEGDVITLVGKDRGKYGSGQLHLADWANLLDTITYELACRLRARMPRVYTRQAVTED